MKRGPCIWTWNLPDIGLKGFSPFHSPFTTMGSWLQQQQQQQRQTNDKQELRLGHAKLPPGQEVTANQPTDRPTNYDGRTDRRAKRDGRCQRVTKGNFAIIASIQNSVTSIFTLLIESEREKIFTCHLYSRPLSSHNAVRSYVFSSVNPYCVYVFMTLFTPFNYSNDPNIKPTKLSS